MLLTGIASPTCRTGRHRSAKGRALASRVPLPRISDDSTVVLQRFLRNTDPRIVTPCHRQPKMWDDWHENERAERKAQRVEQACDLCMDCRVFVQCTAFRDANESLPDALKTHGVVAGTLVTDERSKAHHYIV